MQQFQASAAPDDAVLSYKMSPCYPSSLFAQMMEDYESSARIPRPPLDCSKTQVQRRRFSLIQHAARISPPSRLLGARLRKWCPIISDNELGIVFARPCQAARLVP
eukprot:6992325-Pyramimonas_sp.AAC.1